MTGRNTLEAGQGRSIPGAIPTSSFYAKTPSRPVNLSSAGIGFPSRRPTTTSERDFEDWPQHRNALQTTSKALPRHGPSAPKLSSSGMATRAKTRADGAHEAIEISDDDEEGEKGVGDEGDGLERASTSRPIVSSAALTPAAVTAEAARREEQIADPYSSASKKRPRTSNEDEWDQGVGSSRLPGHDPSRSRMDSSSPSASRLQAVRSSQQGRGDPPDSAQTLRHADLPQTRTFQIACREDAEHIGTDRKPGLAARMKDKNGLASRAFPPSASSSKRHLADPIGRTFMNSSAKQEESSSVPLDLMGWDHIGKLDCRHRPRVTWSQRVYIHLEWEQDGAPKSVTVRGADIEKVQVRACLQATM